MSDYLAPGTTDADIDPSPFDQYIENYMDNEFIDDSFSSTIEDESDFIADIIYKAMNAKEPIDAHDLYLQLQTKFLNENTDYLQRQFERSKNA